MTNLESLRLKVRPLLHFSAPADALFVYYAFYHDPRRTQLTIHEGADGRAEGFVAVCQTGQRLFVPTVVLRTPDAKVAVELLRQALIPGRPYYVISTPDLRDAVAQVVDISEPETNHVYQLDQHLPGLYGLIHREQGRSRGKDWHHPAPTSQG